LSSSNAPAHVELHPIDEVYGLWCDTCCLPSGHSTNWQVVDPDTLRVLGSQREWSCRDCKTYRVLSS
jgi:hypothetical protein